MGFNSGFKVLMMQLKSVVAVTGEQNKQANEDAIFWTSLWSRSSWPVAVRLGWRVQPDNRVITYLKCHCVLLNKLEYFIFLTVFVNMIAEFK